jgi:hypothetical protein
VEEDTSTWQKSGHFYFALTCVKIGHAELGLSWAFWPETNPERGHGIKIHAVATKPLAYDRGSD